MCVDKEEDESIPCYRTHRTRLAAVATRRTPGSHVIILHLQSQRTASPVRPVPGVLLDACSPGRNRHHSDAGTETSRTIQHPITVRGAKPTVWFGRLGPRDLRSVHWFMDATALSRFNMKTRILQVRLGSTPYCSWAAVHELANKEASG